MKTSIKNNVFAVAAIAIAAIVGGLAATQVQAQQQVQALPQAQSGQFVYQPPAVSPTVSPAVVPPVVQQYYFGMSIQLQYTAAGTPALRIVSVTPGGPAQQSGLEVGDEIQTVNGNGFFQARDSFDAVRLLSQYTLPGNGPGTGVPVAATTTANTFYVPPTPAAATGIASMVVRNVRDGRNVLVTVQPICKGGVGGPAPAAATTVRGR